jgi:energy-coupling factor transport system substrate-specific component
MRKFRPFFYAAPRVLRIELHRAFADPWLMTTQQLHSAPLSARNAALALVPLGVLLNLGIGTIVHLLKLPIFVDAVGTILITLLIGWRWGAVTGVVSFLVGGLIVNPVLPWFSGTQATIAIVAGLMASRGWFRTLPRTIVVGILIGICAAIVSAPVIIWLFGGITGSGSGFITSFLLASGKKIVESVILTGLSCEPIDKTIQCLLVFWLVKSLPERFRTRLAPFGYLRQNTTGNA